MPARCSPARRCGSAGVRAGRRVAGDDRRPGQGFNLKDFKTSTGLEVRFFMPVLNVPFRLIFAYNPQRDGVLRQHAVPAEGVPVPVCGGLDLLNEPPIWCRINSFRHSKGFRVMRGSAIAASLALSLFALSAAPVFAQTPAAPAKPAPAHRSRRSRRPRSRAAPPAPAPRRAAGPAARPVSGGRQDRVLQSAGRVSGVGRRPAPRSRASTR